MKFTYTYRSSDGRRHSAEIEAGSRDAAFAAIRREMGVKPIRVVAADGAKAGDEPTSGTRKVPIRVLLVAVGATLAAGIAYWLGARSDGSGDVVVMRTPQGVVTSRVAEPLPRQAIPGNRQRIDGDRDGIFTNSAERWLARFAEPGRLVAEPPGGRPAEAEFGACLREPVRVASTDFTEVVDLKRMVAGMKNEMRAYLAGGGTVDGYLAELERRQRLEISYRERAEQRLSELLAPAGAQPTESGGTGATGVNPAESGGTGATGIPPAAAPNALKSAYAYWLKANAQLQAMGIYPLPLPDALRSYQMSMDIDE